jgi:RNA polymerase sigma factor (TIGR02999 family)
MQPQLHRPQFAPGWAAEAEASATLARQGATMSDSVNGDPSGSQGPDFSVGRRLFQQLSTELRQMAGKIASREVGHTMHPTALVNELFVKLFGGAERTWNDQVHFLRWAATTMRSILLDYKKYKNAVKRGGGTPAEPLDCILHHFEARCGGDILDVHEALEQLASEDPVLADYVSLRIFVGYTNIEASRMLGISERTGERNWEFARAWLKRRLLS